MFMHTNFEWYAYYCHIRILELYALEDFREEIQYKRDKDIKSCQVAISTII